MNTPEDIRSELEEAIRDVVEGIYACSLIPDDHKDRYVEFIGKKGITQEFIAELQKIFDQEIAGIEAEIGDKKSVLSALDDIIAGEEEATAQPRAEVVGAFSSFLDRRAAEVQQNLEQFDREFEGAVEDLKKQDESSQQAAIYEKLGLKK